MPPRLHVLWKTQHAVFGCENESSIPAKIHSSDRAFGLYICTVCTASTSRMCVQAIPLTTASPWLLLIMFTHVLAFTATLLGLLRQDSHTSARASGGALTTVLPPSLVTSYKPFSYYASAAYCKPSLTLDWTCGGMISRVAYKPKIAQGLFDSKLCKYLPL
jgi:hypothetical protein